jgi:hypothetical protein
MMCGKSKEGNPSKYASPFLYCSGTITFASHISNPAQTKLIIAAAPSLTNGITTAAPPLTNKIIASALSQTNRITTAALLQTNRIIVSALSLTNPTTAGALSISSSLNVPQSNSHLLILKIILSAPLLLP